MSSISEFRGAVRSGVARQHKWKVQVNFPVYAGNNNAVRQASLLARTTTTPSSTLGVMDIGWGGRILPLPGDRTFEEYTINFIGVNDMNVRDAFERWQEAINGSESNQGLVNPDDFMRDIQLDMQDTLDNVTKTYILKDAYPTLIAGMDMDSGSQDSYVEFSVTFRYINVQSNTTS